MKKTIIISSLCISSIFNTVYAHSDILGLWGGFGVQGNGSAWTIKMSMNNNKYLIEYPSIPCGGKLQLLSNTNNRYVFHEIITQHKKNCINNGKLVLTLIDSNTMDWKWHDPNNGSITATKVKRYPNLHEYNARVPPLLAKYKQDKQMYNNNTDELGVALGLAAVYGLYKLFSGNGESSSSSSSSYSGSSVALKYGCKFCCEGQFGACKSKWFTVNTPHTNDMDAMDYIKKEYESTCKQFPFYSGGGGTASVSYPDCNTFKYK